MVNKNIFVVLLSIFCVVLPAEHNALDVEINMLIVGIFQKSQERQYEACALILGVFVQRIDKIVRRQEQLSLRQAREKQERIQAQISSASVRISEFRERQADRFERQQMLLQLKKVTHTQQPQYYKNYNRIKQQKHAQHNKYVQQPKSKHRRRG